MQDIVHVGVKLKCRLLKPSIVLPLGNFVAGVHHLRIIHTTFTKDQHGLRERDINDKDKQNYEAVLRMSSESMFGLLQIIPDANGTIAYLYTLRCVIDSYLDKSLTPLERIKKAWFGVFFMRYWRQWIVLNPDYTLGNNFITLNAYMCIELKAHALIIFLLTLKKLSPKTGFFPWLLGSQSCEKAFRAARSMTSIFSTVINFGMLGLLRRLHRMHIQFCLEAESQETGIRYPKVEAHKNKDGYGDDSVQSVENITIQQIAEAVGQSKQQAQEKMKDLGMWELLQCWENPPTPLLTDADFDIDDEQDEEDTVAQTEAQTVLSELDLLQEVNSSEDGQAVASSISDLFSAGITSKKENDALILKHTTAFKKVPSNTIPLFEETDKKSRSARKYCPNVKIERDGKDYFINKTTAVWLLQEGERVSSDRLFRVRNKQPYSSNGSLKNVSHIVSNQPSQGEEISLGNVCVFKYSGMSSWQIGKILKFSYYKQKAKASQQYRGSVAKVTSTENVGVLCSWYSEVEERVYTFSPPDMERIVHSYISISSYLCTLTNGCFQSVENKSTTVSAVQLHDADSESLSLTTAHKFTLTPEALSWVKDHLLATMATVIKINEKEPASTNPTAESWTEYGGHILTKKHLQQIVQGKQLCDLHINAFQCLLKNVFPHVDGLQCTLFQDRTPLKRTLGNLTVQILHVKNCHWATLAIEDNDINLYDSAYSSISKDTMKTIANLVQCKNDSFTVNLMNLKNQTGIADCALYAMAVATCLILKDDPTTAVFHQDELRTHLCQCLEKGTITLFPVTKKRRHVSRVCRAETLSVYCYCRMPDHGQLMVHCSQCGDWFHHQCLQKIPDDDIDFICNICSKKV